MNIVNRKWWLIDANRQTLGRLASKIANILRGKNNPRFSPNRDCGDFVICINAEKIYLSGKKLKNKFYYHHSGYPGGLKKVRCDELLKKHPERLIFMAVRGMLPKNKLRAKFLSKLKVYAGPHHPHQSQKPIPLEV